MARNVTAMLPRNWNTFNPSQKIQWFNDNQVTIDELVDGGVPQGDIDYMLRSGYRPPAAEVTQAERDLINLYRTVLGREPDAEGLAYWKSIVGPTLEENERGWWMGGAEEELANRPATPEDQILSQIRDEQAPAAPAPEPEPAPAAPTNVDSKGRPYNVADYENVKKQLTEQASAGVNHKASFSSNQAEIIDDMAKQLASYGVKSIYDLKQEVYTDLEYPTTTTDEAVEPTEVQKQRVINSATGQEIPLNELNNSRGSGFTYYKIEFANGVPVPYGYKENTGFSAFVDQVSDLAKPLTPILVAIAAPYLAGTGAALGAGATAAPIIDAALTGAVVGGITGQDPLKAAALASLGPITSAYGAQLGQALIGQTAGAATVGSAILGAAGGGFAPPLCGGTAHGVWRAAGGGGRPV